MVRLLSFLLLFCFIRNRICESALATFYFKTVAGVAGIAAAGAELWLVSVADDAIAIADAADLAARNRAGYSTAGGLGACLLEGAVRGRKQMSRVQHAALEGAANRVKSASDCAHAKAAMQTRWVAMKVAGRIADVDAGAGAIGAARAGASRVQR